MVTFKTAFTLCRPSSTRFSHHNILFFLLLRYFESGLHILKYVTIKRQFLHACILCYSCSGELICPCFTCALCCRACVISIDIRVCGHAFHGQAQSHVMLRVSPILCTLWGIALEWVSSYFLCDILKLFLHLLG